MSSQAWHGVRTDTLASLDAQARRLSSAGTKADRARDFCWGPPGLRYQREVTC